MIQMLSEQDPATEARSSHWKDPLPKSDPNSFLSCVYDQKTDFFLHQVKKIQSFIFSRAFSAKIRK